MARRVHGVYCSTRAAKWSLNHFSAGDAFDYPFTQIPANTASALCSPRNRINAVDSLINNSLGIHPDSTRAENALSAGWSGRI